MGGVTIRRIRPDDFREWRAIRLFALADTPSAFGSTLAAEEAFPDERWQELAAQRAASDRDAVFVAVAPDGVFVGLLGCFIEEADPDCAHVVSMATRPEYRRHGLGRRLIEAAADWARQAGATRLELWVTRGNTPAEELYRSAGFAPTGDHQPLPSDPCKDELRMRRSLIGS